MNVVTKEVKKFLEYETRNGSGRIIKMISQQIKLELENGTKDAAKKGRIPELTSSELERLFEIITEPTKIVSLPRGKEIVLTRDGGVLKYTGCSRYAGVPMSKEQAVLVGERFIGFDTMEIGHADYSIKPVKTFIDDEAHHMENIQMECIIPCLYGAMPNLGVYYQSLGGRWPSPTELMKQGKLKEAQTVQEEAAEELTKDILFIAKTIYRAGSDGLNFDTTAAAGDAEFYATLKAVETIAQEINLPVEVGMASEMIIGTHTTLEYDGKRLAGLWPHQQGKLVEKAGASIFGPAVNTKTTASFPWNLARALTFIKVCTKEVQIPVHVNMGMGVGGIPMSDIPPVDAVSRAAKAMVEIANVDGI